MQQRLDAGVDRRGDAPLVLAEFGEDGVSRSDVAVRPAFAGDGERALLMRRVLVAVQEVDHERIAACRLQRRDRGAHRRLVQRHQHLAGGIHALRHLDAQLARNQRREAAGEAIGIGSRAPAKLEDVAEALGRDQPRAAELAFQQRVGGDRGAVNDGPDVRKRCRRAVERREHACRLVRGRGWHLGEPDGAALGLHENQVGEGSADVHTDDSAAHGVLMRLWWRRRFLPARACGSRPGARGGRNRSARPPASPAPPRARRRALRPSRARGAAPPRP